MKKLLSVTTALFLTAMFAVAQQAKSEKLAKMEEALKADAPKLLCLNEAIATAGQPKDEAFAKLAAHGFRSVLNLRTTNEGVDLQREQELTEKAGMKYLSVPVTGSAPQPEAVVEFIRVVKEKSHHPMLIHCATANRVGAFWMIYRVLEEGWSEEQALAEATQIGLTNPALKKFAEDYIAKRKSGV